ncbi:hypothetical protein KFL_012280015 [Klebsormidium nitens]|uniref:DDE Tnp4 domain-containing protein n=1 Tax=Klebsormidium nitens TaxID=105231 RepID=A0A1Y1IXF4_KLENI|nr:hypothetical protein KFL_012280015 [Klebsormidium nitens]|eukprot:GAQ92968.1 hypothetical protein KFL_012280015 [Klebsormidium nitens]
MRTNCRCWNIGFVSATMLVWAFLFLSKVAYEPRFAICSVKEKAGRPRRVCPVWPYIRSSGLLWIFLCPRRRDAAGLFIRLPDTMAPLWQELPFFSVLVSLMSTIAARTLGQPLPFARRSHQMDTEDDDRVYLIVGLSSLDISEDLLPIEKDMTGKFYIKPCSLAWWNSFYQDVASDEARWHKLLRVSRGTFQELEEELKEALETNVPKFSFSKIPNRILTVDRQLAMTLHRLATGNSAFTISELFGVSEPTLYLTVRKVCSSIWYKLKPQHVFLPSTPAGMQKVIDGFEEKRGLPNCCGAIDCTHFVLELPNKETSTCWFDRDHNYSMIMQGLVDADGKFLDVCIGWPGSTNDSRVLRNSELCHKIINQEWLQGPTKRLRGCDVGQYIVGDSGFPAYSWLVVPYPGDHLPEVRDRFNYFHSSTRIIVECAFGRLKGIWRILLRRIYKPDIKFLPITIGACVVLHNMMLQNGDYVNERLIPLPDEPEPAGPNGGRGNQDAASVRDALAEYLFWNC